MIRQYRQGDVLLCAIDRIPEAARPIPSDGDRVVIAQGELTGHAHVFAAAAVQMLRDAASGRRYLVIGEEGAALRHDEHEPIVLPEGRYEVRRQREYQPGTTRFVSD
jgi:hypothetical protein